MKNKKYFIPIVALLTIANISFSAIQNESKSNFTLKSFLNIKTAEAEHTSTYTCWDESYKTTSSWPYTIKNRVCDAPDCGKVYTKNLGFPDTGSCTVTYE